MADSGSSAPLTERDFAAMDHVVALAEARHEDFVSAIRSLQSKIAASGAGAAAALALAWNAVGLLAGKPGQAELRVLGPCSLLAMVLASVVFVLVMIMGTGAQSPVGSALLGSAVDWREKLILNRAGNYYMWYIARCEEACKDLAPQRERLADRAAWSSWSLVCGITLAVIAVALAAAGL